MSVAVGIATGGVVVAVLGLIAAAVAPKGVGSDDPDDDAVQPWTAWMFALGLLVALWGLCAWGIHDAWHWPESVAFIAIGYALSSLFLWGAVVYRFTRRGR